MSSKVDARVLAEVWSDPVKGSLAILAMLGVTGVIAQMVPGIVKLRTWVVVMAMITIITMAVVAGPVIWKALVIFAEVVLGLLLFSRTAEFILLFMTLCVVTLLQLVVSTLLVCSPREVEMVMTVAGAVIVIVTMVLVKMTMNLQELVVGLLGVGGFAYFELFIVAIASMRVGRSTIVFCESPVAQMVMEILVMMIFMAVPVVVLKTQETVVALFRGALLLCAFQTRANVLLPLDKLHPVLVFVILLMVRWSTTVSKEPVLMKGVVLILHLLALAGVDILIAALISQPEEEAELWAVYLGNCVNVTLILAMTASIEGTALRYAAGHNHTNCGVLLVEAGAEVKARNRLLNSPVEVAQKMFVDAVQEVESLPPNMSLQ